MYKYIQIKRKNMDWKTYELNRPRSDDELFDIAKDVNTHKILAVKVVNRSNDAQQKRQSSFLVIPIKEIEEFKFA